MAEASRMNSLLTETLIPSASRTENCKTLQGMEMNTPDTHWQWRLNNFRKALLQLDEAMELMSRRPLSKLERQGAFHLFECSYELAWNTLKDFLVWQGIEGIVGSRDTIREAFSAGLIADGQGWMRMLTDRGRTSHTYNEETAEAILLDIRQQHHPLLEALERVLSSRTEPSA
ncbi:nucleotidyltransferase substrate binding protein [Azotobacter vinelandii]